MRKHNFDEMMDTLVASSRDEWRATAHRKIEDAARAHVAKEKWSQARKNFKGNPKRKNKKNEMHVLFAELPEIILEDGRVETARAGELKNSGTRLGGREKWIALDPASGDFTPVAHIRTPVDQKHEKKHAFANLALKAEQKQWSSPGALDTPAAEVDVSQSLDKHQLHPGRMSMKVAQEHVAHLRDAQTRESKRRSVHAHSVSGLHGASNRKAHAAHERVTRGEGSLFVGSEYAGALRY